MMIIIIIIIIIISSSSSSSSIKGSGTIIDPNNMQIIIVPWYFIAVWMGLGSYVNPCVSH